MNFTDTDRAFIRKNFPNAEELLNATELFVVLEALYDLIDDKGFAPPHYVDYNDFGDEAQRVYDSIYYNNQ